MAAPIELLGVYIDHYRDKQSRAYLGVKVGKSDTIREIPMDEGALLDLAIDAADTLRILRKVNAPDA